jgi:hypothetical protein
MLAAKAGGAAAIGGFALNTAFVSGTLGIPGFLGIGGGAIAAMGQSLGKAVVERRKLQSKPLSVLLKLDKIQNR